MSRDGLKFKTRSCSKFVSLLTFFIFQRYKIQYKFGNIDDFAVETSTDFPQNGAFAIKEKVFSARGTT